MADRAVLVTRPRLCSIGDIITIDACREETHTLSNQVTDHPVEEGFNITDHSRPDPDVVQLTCFISNTPLSQEQKTRAVQEGSVKFDTTAQTGTTIGAVDGRGADIFKKLKKLRDEGTLIKLVTTLKTYGLTDTEGMTIQSLSVPRTSKNYDGIEFTAIFKQIRVVKNKQTTNKQSKQPNVPKKKSKGQQTPKPVEVEESAAFRGKQSLDAAKASGASTSGQAAALAKGVFGF